MYDGNAGALQEKVKQVCYAFYRYEIKSGLKQLEALTEEIAPILADQHISETQHQELTDLLKLILLAVGNRDYLIAADLLMYELLGRIRAAAGSSE